MKALIVALIISLLALGQVQAEGLANQDRLNEVANRGRDVMPFSLEKTTHLFSKTAKGGIQQVIAKDHSDGGQIKLIREHLFKISQAFKRGNFSDPIKIHGENMPGLAELTKAKPDRLNICYEALPNGGQVTYSTEDPKLVRAIQDWFDAQLSEHASHAMPGHDHHFMHSKP
ncbi:cytochrome c family protein [Methyloglobulus morosus KoM1]|uniref:Cytochrome c family protein n=1 Tax=Methyloglobulus morosus KoM1 TaxID=1116472 RepID=V5C3F6_9GAMM|nr:hypothetical protein [Methyloglobulus morosus]ESS73007.1 cytochrome c family protein [Methyloglobulus morosus KoM1]